jgi:hypothetical protein
MRHPRLSLGVCVGLILQLPVAACAPQLVPLQRDRESMPAPRSEELFEVIVSVAGGADPMPVRGSRVIYGGLTEATGRFVAGATRAWVERHRAQRMGGWQLLVEIIRSDAEAKGERLTVELETRVTLRGALGQIHLGQTRGYCKVSGPLAEEAGAPVVYQCLGRMARDLSGWLEGLNP